jgi:multidrug efflux pump subunit AcrB
VLVFATLLLVLNWRVALWVGVGLLTALFGTMILMAQLGVTLNLLTLFGLIVVLGLLVDDAIVVSENIQTHHDQGEEPFHAAIAGTHQVLWPVVATVATSVVAFLPLTFIRGRIGDLLGALPIVVACALMMSLVESLLILPSHMGHSLKNFDSGRPGRLAAWGRRFEIKRDQVVFEVLIPFYRRLLMTAIRSRYITVTIAVAALVVSAGLVQGRWVVYNFMPKQDAETYIVDVRMPIGTPVERTSEVVKRIEQAAQAQSETLSISTIIGQRTNIDTGQTAASASHVAQLFVELKFVEDRDRESNQVIDSVRHALVGRLDEVERISFAEMSGGPGGPDIQIQVRGPELSEVTAAVNDLKRQLARFDGVDDIADDNDLGQMELQLNVKPDAAALGFSTQQVAEQVRGFVYGLDAHVFSAKQEDIDVRVRLDESDRRSLYGIENSWLVSDTGRPVPLSQIADITQRTTYATIKRIDRERAVTVTASTTRGKSPESIVERLAIEKLRVAYPSVMIEYGGRQQQQADAFASLPIGFGATLLMIYVILAWLFASYTQPLIVMLVIPFALIGVVWGHLLLGYDLTFLSLIGAVALSGIVVNDSLILVQFFNVQRQKGLPIFDALVAAGQARMRAILLTTVTTALGLTPLILETSFQAKFLIPMAISIAMGLVAATVVVLVVLPCFMLIFQDVKWLLFLLWFGHPCADDGHQVNSDRGQINNVQSHRPYP